MTQQSRQFISKYSYFFDISKSTPKVIWLQLYPLTGPQSGYKKVYNVCHINRCTVLGLFLCIGVIKYLKNDIHFQRDITEEIQMMARFLFNTLDVLLNILRSVLGPGIPPLFPHAGVALVHVPDVALVHVPDVDGDDDDSGVVDSGGTDDNFSDILDAVCASGKDGSV